MCVTFARYGKCTTEHRMENFPSMKNRVNRKKKLFYSNFIVALRSRIMLWMLIECMKSFSVWLVLFFRFFFVARIEFIFNISPNSISLLFPVHFEMQCRKWNARNSNRKGKMKKKREENCIVAFAWIHIQNYNGNGNASNFSIWIVSFSDFHFIFGAHFNFQGITMRWCAIWHPHKFELY